MNKQFIILVVFMFVVSVAYWVTSPAYKGIRTGYREEARNYLIQTYYGVGYGEDIRQQMIRDYGFTDDDINPNKIIQGVIDETNNQNF